MALPSGLVTRSSVYMSLCALRRGNRIKIGASEFLILQRLPEERWQLQNSMTGEWCIFDESDLLDRFTRHELSFVVKVHGCDPITNELAEKLNRDLASYAPWLIALASKRVHYLKEIDGRQPISMVPHDIQPLIQTVSGALSDSSPPSVRTVCRDYRKWISAGRDIRAILFRYSDRGQTRYANAAGGKGDQ
jgi:hypothetical protein